MSSFILGIVVFLVLFVVLGTTKNGDSKKWSMNAKQLISLVGIGIAVTSFIQVVPTGHTGIVTVFGKVKGETLDAGVHFVMPWEDVVCMDNRIQKVTVNMSSTTSDMQDVEVTFTLNYQISKSNASEIYRSIGTNYEGTVVNPQVANTVKSVMAQFAATELIADRNNVSSKTNEELKNVLSKYNIEIIDTAIENLTFSQAFTESIEAKVIAEQNYKKSQTEQEQKNYEIEQEAKRKVTEANGTAEANRILSESINEKILQKNFIDKWNGELPQVVGSGQNVFDISGYVGQTE